MAGPRRLTRSQQKEGGHIRGLRQKVWTAHTTCSQCGEGFTHNLLHAPLPQFCGDECRDKAKSVYYHTTRYEA